MKFSRENFASYGVDDRLVYIKPVLASDIGIDISDRGFKSDMTLYSVCRADGERLAILTDRAASFSMALAHDMLPLSVH